MSNRANLGTASLLSQSTMIHVPIIARVQFVFTPIDIDRYTFGVNNISKRRVRCFDFNSCIDHWTRAQIKLVTCSCHPPLFDDHCPQHGDKTMDNLQSMSHDQCAKFNVWRGAHSLEPCPFYGQSPSSVHECHPFLDCHNPCIMANVQLFSFDFEAL